MGDLECEWEILNEESGRTLETSKTTNNATHASEALKMKSSNDYLEFAFSDVQRPYLSTYNTLLKELP